MGGRGRAIAPEHNIQHVRNRARDNEAPRSPLGGCCFVCAYVFFFLHIFLSRRLSSFMPYSEAEAGKNIACSLVGFMIVPEHADLRGNEQYAQS